MPGADRRRVSHTRVLRMVSRLVVGGPAHNVCQLSAGLNEENFSTWLVHGRAEPGERSFPELAIGLGIEPMCINSLRRKLGCKDISALLAIRRLMHQIKPHIVHTHTAKAGAIGRIAARAFRARGIYRPCVVHTFHGHVFEGYFSRRMSSAVVLVERALASMTDAIVAVSQSVKRDIVDIYGIAPERKVHVIPLGFDFDWIPSLRSHRGWLRQELGVSKDTLIVGTVGRLVPIKNHHLTLDGFRRLLETHDDARLVFFGDGELRAGLETRARELGIYHKVCFAGWELDLAKLYADLNITCLASRSEGTPVALIESLAAGIPVVATAVGGVPDVVSDASLGELVHPDDAEGLAHALSRVAAQEAHIDPRQSEAVRSKYSVQRLTSDTAALYREILARSPATLRGPASERQFQTG